MVKEATDTFVGKWLRGTAIGTATVARRWYHMDRQLGLIDQNDRKIFTLAFAGYAGQ